MMTIGDVKQEHFTRPKEDYDKLLRVARAAEIAWPYMFEDIPKKLNSKRSKYEKLYEALKEVEHLL